MKRIPARLVLQLLAAHGHPIQPATLRKWTQRHHITHTKDGYHPAEILTHLKTRGLYSPR